jgi:hypothetical protein
VLTEEDATLVILVKKVASSSTTGAFWEKAEATNELLGRRAKATYQRYFVLFTDLEKNLPAAQFVTLGLIRPRASLPLKGLPRRELRKRAAPSPAAPEASKESGLLRQKLTKRSLQTEMISEKDWGATVAHLTLFHEVLVNCKKR